MSKIALEGNAAGTGTFTIASPNSNTSRTLTLPDATGTVVLDTTLPPAPAADVQTFNSAGTWTKPAAGTMARIQVWGGGGGGGRETGTNLASGGGGGGYNETIVPLDILASTVSVTVAAGGVGRTGSTGEGTAGGSSSFGTLVVAYGGEQGYNNSSSGGGTVFSGIFFKAGVGVLPEIYGGNSILGGTGNPSIYGGGGGAGSTGTSNTTGGPSYYGGSGGNGGRSTTNIDGTAPGGGGGGRNNDLNGGNGAAGRVVVTVW
jgi:hypothetical protein